MQGGQGVDDKTGVGNLTTVHTNKTGQHGRSGQKCESRAHAILEPVEFFIIDRVSSIKAALSRNIVQPAICLVLI